MKMKSPLSRTFRIFLWVLAIETISQNLDPNELFNKQPILGLEVVNVDGNDITTESLQNQLYARVPAGYIVEVLGFEGIEGIV